jgi:homoserine kinase type II
MGIKVELTLDELKEYIDATQIEKTVDGVRDSVYIIDNKYVLKIFEDITNECIDNEKVLLNRLKELSVPQMRDEIYTIKGKFATLYTKIEGKSLKNPNNNQIKEIAKFMRSFHNITKDTKSSNIKLFEKDRLKEMILSTNSKKLLDIYSYIDIELKNDGVIHGDLFMDNAKFCDDKLCGVFDFVEACEGDSLFDLAVVAISWCYVDRLDLDKLDILISEYDSSIDRILFFEYMKYAMLYYATTRYISGRDYAELIDKIERLYV